MIKNIIKKNRHLFPKNEHLNTKQKSDVMIFGKLWSLKQEKKGEPGECCYN